MLINRLLHLTQAFLSYFVRKEKGYLLLGACGGKMFRGNPKYLFIHLSHYHHNKKFAWITGNKEVYNELKRNHFQVIYKYSLEGFWAMLKAQYLIMEVLPEDILYTAHNIGRFKMIQTWHGTPIKQICYHEIMNRPKPKNIREKLSRWLEIRNLKKYHFIGCTSSLEVHQLREAFQNKKVEVLGYARNDVLFNRNLLYRDYNKILNLNKYDLVLLYAPTFRDNKKGLKPFNNKTLQALDNYFKENNYIMLVKKHEADDNVKLMEGLTNIREVSDQVDDIQDLLVCVDVLISDYSGVITDFALLDREIVLYPYDFEEYVSQCRELYWDYDKLTQSHKYLKEVTNDYHDGNSCERLLEEIERRESKWGSV